MQPDYDSPIENITIYINLSGYSINSSYGNNTNSTSTREVDRTVTYIIVSVVFISFCIISAIVNTRILICTKWIRRPLSPTLYISVSLALADAYLSVLLGLGFFVNSLLPRGLHIPIENFCLVLTLEAFRLSAILISTIHLLVLAGNHYLGILCPFLSRRWLTHKNLMGVMIFIWTAPTVFIFSYFSLLENQGYQAKNCTDDKTLIFIMLQHFRAIYSGLFFIPLILMFIIYFHISIIVRRHQASRRWFNRHSRRHDLRSSRNDQEQQFERNLKAIWTSMLILSTYIICFLPAVILFILMCADCYYEMINVDGDLKIYLGITSNFLLITKPLINPLIYASRMQEIRAAMRRMNADCRAKLCLFVSSDDLDRAYNSSGIDGFHIGRSSRISRMNQYSFNSVHLGNGFSRSIRRKTEDVTTDL